MTWALLLAGACCLATSPTLAADTHCGGAAHCRVDGTLMAQVVQVNVTDSGGITASHGVRMTIRFTNVGTSPLVLGYKDQSSHLSDDHGLVYKRSSQAEGIGRVTHDNADPQFQLAPGESREANFTNVLQYNVRYTVPGRVFQHDLTLVRLAVEPNGRIRSTRTYVLDFPGLTATSGLGAGAAQRGIAPATTAQADAASGACGGQPHCQAQGPIRVQVVGVNVTDSGGVTAVHSVRTLLRIQNVGQTPVILAYPAGSAHLSDNQGLGYSWAQHTGKELQHVHGIGVLHDGAVDTSFQLAPGEAREASFENTLKYNTRNTHPGTVFNLDITLAQLAVLGNHQVETQHKYTMTFSNLNATSGLTGLGGGSAAGAANAVQAVGKIVNLLKGLGK